MRVDEKTAEKKSRQVQRESRQTEKEQGKEARELRQTEKEQEQTGRKSRRSEKKREKVGTKDLILEVAKAEFLEKGFHETSLRNIVEKAGVTTGSFYWYFKNKEELFETLIGEHCRHITQIYKNYVIYSESLPMMERMREMRTRSLLYINEILKYMYEHVAEFKILISGSAGTKYENFLHEMVESKISDTVRFREALRSQGFAVKEVSGETEHILVSGMLTSVFELVTHEIPLEKAKLCMKDLVAFYTAGWFYLMNIDVKNESFFDDI